MHLRVWATMGRDARRHDDQAAFIIFDCYWKRWLKTRASGRNAAPVHWISWLRIRSGIGLTMTFSLKSQHWWGTFSEHRRSCMHFIGVCQSIITWWMKQKLYSEFVENCDFDKTLCWWFLLERNLEQIIPDSYFKGKLPLWSPYILHLFLVCLYKDKQKMMHGKDFQDFFLNYTVNKWIVAYETNIHLSTGCGR